MSAFFHEAPRVDSFCDSDAVALVLGVRGSLESKHCANVQRAPGVTRGEDPRANQAISQARDQQMSGGVSSLEVCWIKGFRDSLSNI